jgi:hypothetical protein
MGVPVADARRIHHDNAERDGYTAAGSADIAARRDAVIERSRAQRKTD